MKLSSNNTRRLFKSSISSSLLGILFGVIISSNFSNITCSEIAKYLILIADSCIRLFQMIVTPLIFLGSIVFTYFKFSDHTNTKYELVKNKFITLVILLGAVGLSALHMGSFVNAFRNFDLHSIFNLPINISASVIFVVPKSIFESLSENNIIQILVFSVVFGLAAARLRSNSKPIIEFIYVAYIVMHKMLQPLIYLVPVIVFCVIAAIIIL